MLYYLATPYTKFSSGLDAAHEMACRAAAECFDDGILVFCPIAHTHRIAQLLGIGVGFDIWKSLDEEMMAACSGIIVRISRRCIRD
jgi:hypothetical protein